MAAGAAPQEVPLAQLSSGDDPQGDVPHAPSGLTASAAGANQINLTWVDGSDNETGFKIQRSGDDFSEWTTIATVGAGVTIYADNVPATRHALTIIGSAHTTARGRR